MWYHTSSTIWVVYLKTIYTIYHCGTKSSLGLGPSQIWAWDQIEFGPGTKSNLGPRPNRIWNHLDGDFRMMTNHTKADTLPWSTYPKVYVICSCKDHWRFQLSQIQLVPNILCTSPIIFKIHYITTSNDWLHKNITTMDDITTWPMQMTMSQDM